MKYLVLIIALSLSMSVHSGKWTPLTSYDAFTIYNFDKMHKNVKSVDVVGTSGHSWPDGRQATFTFYDVKGDKNKWLFKCIDYFDKDMQSTGGICYELRDDKNLPFGFVIDE